MRKIRIAALSAVVIALAMTAMAQSLPRRKTLSTEKNTENGKNNLSGNASYTRIPAKEPRPFVSINEKRGAGAIALSIRKVNSDYEIGADDYTIIALPAYQGGPTTITIFLPDVAGNEGKLYIIKNAGEGYVHVAARNYRELGDNFNVQTGAAPVRDIDVIRSSGAIFQSDGKYWWKIYASF